MVAASKGQKNKSSKSSSDQVGNDIEDILKKKIEPSMESKDCKALKNLSVVYRKMDGGP